MRLKGRGRENVKLSWTRGGRLHGILLKVRTEKTRRLQAGQEMH